jgi:hypothetical protein
MCDLHMHMCRYDLVEVGLIVFRSILPFETIPAPYFLLK